MSGLSDSAKAKRLNDIKRRLAAMQRVKGKALNVTVSDAEESGSDDGQDSRRDNGWAIRRERREEREEEKDRVKRREEEKERLKRLDKHAPMVMSAKRMVTRKRNAIEPEKIVGRVESASLQKKLRSLRNPSHYGVAGTKRSSIQLDVGWEH